MSAVVLASLFPKFFSSLRGAQEIGTFLIYIFFVVIGCPADLWSVIKNAPLLFLFCGIIAAINILFTIGVGKIFKLPIEELTVSSNANLGGPSSAAAMAVAKGYNDLIIPAILVGLWGYMIGTPLGLIITDLARITSLQRKKDTLRGVFFHACAAVKTRCPRAKARLRHKGACAG